MPSIVAMHNNVGHFGMQAHGVIGNQGANPVELEAVPSVSLTLAQMEGTEVSTFSITGPVLPDAGA